MLGREARATEPQLAGAGGREQLPARFASGGFLKVEPNVLIPFGWAAWRRSRMLASVARTACGELGRSVKRARDTISSAARTELR